MEKTGKKILFVSRPLSPPWDEASKNLAYFLAQNVNGFEVAIMVKDELPGLSDNVIQEKVYQSSQVSEFTFKEKMRSLLFQRRQKGRFDINHYFFTPTRLNTFLIRNFLLSKNTRTIQTVATLREDLWSDDDLKKLIFADQVVTYSDRSREKLEKLGFSGVTRIYPGIDLELYQERPKNLSLLSKFGINQGDFVITYPGEYVRLGATDLIVEAFLDIQKEIPDSRLVLACRVKNDDDQKKKEEVVKRLKEQEILEKVVFTDTFSDMEKIYNLSDIILFPVSDMKGKFDVPLVIPEAQGCQKTVIVSDLPMFREFANENNSVIIGRDDKEALVQAVIGLKNDPEKRRKLGENGRRSAEENFDIKKVAGQYEKIYGEI